MLNQLTPNAARVCHDRWQRPDETIEVMFHRVADHISRGDKTLADTFYNVLSAFDLVPSSPIFMGSPDGNLAACFVLPIEDSMKSIMHTLANAAQVQKWGGGCGFSFNNLREKGAGISTSGGGSCGPLGFITGYNGFFEIIAQGGLRKGANGAQLSTDHPDIIDFIEAKNDPSVLSCFNLSVVITDEFMCKVTRLEPEAVAIWNTLCASALRTGEPGVLFIDAANRANTVPHIYEFEAVNPCGEFFLGPYECCAIASINLAHHVKDGAIDWDKLRGTIETGIVFLDNVIDANNYIPGLPQFQEAQEFTRRVGLSILGTADLLYMMGKRYGTIAGNEVIDQIVEFIRYHAMRTSSELARIHGNFPAFQPEHYHKPFSKLWVSDIGRPDLDWDTIDPTQGMRNASLVCAAPTGTASTVAGVEGYGCEPVFALAYDRKFEGELLHYESPLFKAALIEAGISEPEIARIMQDVRHQGGSCQAVVGIPETVRSVFVVQSDLTPDEQVMAGAAVQDFADNGVSQTVGLDPDATLHDVRRALFLAWQLNRKGLTVYRRGSRADEPLECASGECVVPG